jgi:hypothetical protein
MSRTIREIAGEIHKEWYPVNFAAVPYLRAMRDLETISDSYGYDDGRSIVLYFLSNARTWRGDSARRIKKELNSLLKN